MAANANLKGASQMKTLIATEIVKAEVETTQSGWLVGTSTEHRVLATMTRKGIKCYTGHATQTSPWVEAMLAS